MTVILIWLINYDSLSKKNGRFSTILKFENFLLLQVRLFFIGSTFLVDFQLSDSQKLFQIAQRLVTVCIADTPSTDLPGCDNTTVTILYRNDLHTLYKR